MEDNRILTADFALGVIDVLMAFGGMLVGKGTVTPDELKATLVELQRQQVALDGDGRPSRKTAGLLLQQAFANMATAAGAAPRLSVIEGGRRDEPPAQE